MSDLPTTVAELIQSVKDANATRYCNVAGVVILLYDLFLTWRDEYRYVWKGDHSLSKFAFLLNRYIALSVLIANTNEMAGLTSQTFSDSYCQRVLIASLFLGSMSIAVSDFFVLQRVIELFEGNKSMNFFLYGAFAVNATLSVSLTIVSCVNAWPGIQWSPVVDMCISTSSNPVWTPLWGSPVFFEVVVVSAVIFNSLSTPRSATIPLRKNLQRDGILFFLTILAFRLVNTIIAASSRTSAKLVAIELIWACDTVVLNHFMIRRGKALEPEDIPFDLDELGMEFDLKAIQV